jgi:hypothetical protein
MDTLHTVLRSLQPANGTETKSRREHLDVFREFLDHLDRAARKRSGPRGAKAAKGKGRRGRR